MPSWWGLREIEGPVNGREWDLLELLLAGGGDFLRLLRVQAHELLLYAQRRRSPEQYYFGLVWDGNRDKKYVATAQPSVWLRDLCVLVEHVSVPLRVEAYVSYGVLGYFSLRPHAGHLRWPRTLVVKKWGYLTGEEWDGSLPPDRQRVHVPQFLPPGQSGPAPPWAASIDLTHAVLFSGAPTELIGALRARVGELPKEYEQFLQWSDGATIGPRQIGGSGDAYLLDSDVTDRRVLVISSNISGDVIGLDIDATNAKGESPVVEFLHDPWSQRVVAKSFKGWLRTIASEH